MTAQPPHWFSFQHSFLPRASLSSQTCPKRYGRQAGRQAGVLQPTLPPSRCPPPCPTTARAGESQGVTAEGSNQQRDFADGGGGVKINKSAIHCLLYCIFFTFFVHCLTVLTSSEMTMSTHLVQGSLIFPICLFTMVSKAMSGVKRPVLPGRERTSRTRPRTRPKKKRKEGGGLGKEKSVNC